MYGTKHSRCTLEKNVSDKRTSRNNFSIKMRKCKDSITRSSATAEKQYVSYASMSFWSGRSIIASIALCIEICAL